MQIPRDVPKSTSLTLGFLYYKGENMTEIPSVTGERQKKERLPRARRVLRQVARGAIALTGGATVIGLGLFANSSLKGNWNDTEDLMRFTSPDEQDSRCDIQAAFDAQVTMFEHFEEQGGITQEQAEAMAPVVGLTADQIISLTGTDLYDMDYDCESPEASSSLATKGLLAGAVAGGLIVGTVGGVTYAAIKPKSRNENTSKDNEGSSDDN